MFLENCFEQFHKDSNGRYKIADECVEKVFHEWKENNTQLHIFTKVALLDALYNTRIDYPEAMTLHIMELEKQGVNRKIDKDDKSAVEDIRHGHRIHNYRKGKKGKEKDLYSFAIKYCHWQSKGEHFPIYDRVIGEVIWKFYSLGREKSFGTFKRKHLDDYLSFSGYIEKLGTETETTNMSIRKFDHAFWILGKYKGLGSKNSKPTLSRETMSFLSRREEELGLKRELEFLTK